MIVIVRGVITLVNDIITFNAHERVFRDSFLIDFVEGVGVYGLLPYEKKVS